MTGRIVKQSAAYSMELPDELPLTGTEEFLRAIFTGNFGKKAPSFPGNDPSRSTVRGNDIIFRGHPQSKHRELAPRKPPRRLGLPIKGKSVGRKEQQTHIYIDSINILPSRDRQSIELPLTVVHRVSDGSKLRPRHLLTGFCQLSVLADGVFGTVLHGTNREEGGPSAVKILPSYDEDEFEEGFHVASKLMALSAEPDIRSNFIVKVTDCWYENIDEAVSHLYPFDIRGDEGHFHSFFAVEMEFCTLKDLQTYFEANEQSPDLDLSLKLEIVGGLEFLHAGGIVLGNLNPSNILLKRTMNGVTAKIGGYIFNRNSRQMCQDSERYMENYYQSPEILQPNKASDVYSLGVILFAFNLEWQDPDERGNLECLKQLERFRRAEFPPSYPDSIFHREFLLAMTRRNPESRPPLSQVKKFILTDVPAVQVGKGKGNVNAQ